ncbi:hypothetical protein L7F22_046787 [Adiantum nelumboides]|nr:hypothetical protein [Adiantum nelumboides]
MDFNFMGGSMGSVVGEKITRLIEYATQKLLPLVLIRASGGARMQEGTLSLMQMAKISSVLQLHQVQKNCFTYLFPTYPTTGGVTASFGMLERYNIAESKAYIAFAVASAKDLIPILSSNQITFLPQGLVMCFYGIAGLFLGLYYGVLFFGMWGADITILTGVRVFLPYFDGAFLRRKFYSEYMEEKAAELARFLRVSIEGFEIQLKSLLKVSLASWLGNIGGVPLRNFGLTPNKYNYENPREATGRIVCANCHLAKKIVDLEAPQSDFPILPSTGSYTAKLYFQSYHQTRPNKEAHFSKYPIYVGGNRGRGQIYPDGSKSNNTVYTASSTGRIKGVARREGKGGYEITIEESAGGREAVDVILLVPNSLFRKKKQFEKVQLAEMNF